MKTIKTLAILALLSCFSFVDAQQQKSQKIGYVDSNQILEKMPEYVQAKQSIDQQAQQWEQELDRLKDDVEQLFREYQARELLYTQDERRSKQERIRNKERELDQMRTRYFGTEGELFKKQEQVMRPLQEKVLNAIDAVAKRESYDFIFDKGGDYIFLFARENYDISKLVLEELGINTKN
jgi:outer membrane protein